MSVSMLHSVFSSFYVDFFVRQRLRRQGGTSDDSLTYFACGQLAYALWNGLNDLGFGWLGDTTYSVQSRRRFGRILVGGPLWALVFAIIWMPLDISFLHPAIQFSLLMILYDGFFSFTSVAFRALLVDISHNPSEREICNMYAAVLHVIGSVGVFVASVLYESQPGHVSAGRFGEGDPLIQFRVFTTVWAALAAVGFVVSSRAGHEVLLITSDATAEEPVAALKGKRFFRFAKETCTRSSMIATILVWCVQEYSCTFATNFFSLFLALAAKSYISSGVRSGLLLASFLIPHAVTISLTPFMSTIGKKKIIASLFAARGIVGCLILALWATVRNATWLLPTDGHSSAVIFSILLLLNRVLTEAVCRLQSLVISDVCDEDTAVFKRDASHAAAIHGLVSVASKPFQSLAPVVTCYVLAAGGVDFARANDDQMTSSAVVNAVMQSVTLLLGVTTVVTSCTMLVPWLLLYNLEGRRLVTIQHQVQKRTLGNDHCNVEV